VATPVIEVFTTNRTEGTASSLTLSKPVGVVAGELLLILVANENSANGEGFGAITSESGWTQIFNYGSGNVDTYIGAYYKIATGTENETVTVPFIASDDGLGWYIRISGVDATNPIGYVRSATESTNYYVNMVGDYTYPQTDNPLMIGLASFDGSDGMPLYTSSTGWVNESSIDSPKNSNSGGASSAVFTSCSTITSSSQQIPTLLIWSTGSVVDGFIGTLFEIRSPSSLNLEASLSSNSTIYARGSIDGEIYAETDWVHYETLGGGSASWTNPTFIETENGVGAQYDAGSNITSPTIGGDQWWDGTNMLYDLVPSDATIYGIEVRVKAQPSSYNIIKDANVLITTPSKTSSNKASSAYWETGGYTTRYYGGTTDLWGLTGGLTPSELGSSARFSFLYSFKNYDASTRYLYIDVIELKIHYSYRDTNKNGNASLSASSSLTVDGALSTSFSASVFPVTLSLIQPTIIAVAPNVTVTPQTIASVMTVEPISIVSHNTLYLNTVNVNMTMLDALVSIPTPIVVIDTFEIKHGVDNEYDFLYADVIQELEPATYFYLSIIHEIQDPEISRETVDTFVFKHRLDFDYAVVTEIVPTGYPTDRFSYFKLDGDFQDEEGNLSTLSPVDDPIWEPFDIFDMCLKQSEKTDSYAQLTSQYSNYTNYTLSFWVEIGNDRVSYDYFSADVYGWMSFLDGGYNMSGYDFPNKFCQNRMNHVAVVYENPYVYVFVNGDKVRWDGGEYYKQTLVDSRIILSRIGLKDQTGHMAEMELFLRALSMSEVRQLYAKHANKPLVIKQGVMQGNPTAMIVDTFIVKNQLESSGLNYYQYTKSRFERFLIPHGVLLGTYNIIYIDYFEVKHEVESEVLASIDNRVIGESDIFGDNSTRTHIVSTITGFKDELSIQRHYYFKYGVWIDPYGFNSFQGDNMFVSEEMIHLKRSGLTRSPFGVTSLRPVCSYRGMKSFTDRRNGGVTISFFMKMFDANSTDETVQENYKHTILGSHAVDETLLTGEDPQFYMTGQAIDMLTFYGVGSQTMFEMTSGSIYLTYSNRDEEHRMGLVDTFLLEQKFNHFALSIDMQTAEAILYMNHKEVGRTTASDPNGFIHIYRFVNGFIGGMTKTDPSGRYIDISHRGKFAIDNIRIIDRVLNTSEIAKLEYEGIEGMIISSRVERFTIHRMSFTQTMERALLYKVGDDRSRDTFNDCSLIGYWDWKGDGRNKSLYRTKETKLHIDEFFYEDILDYIPSSWLGYDSKNKRNYVKVGSIRGGVALGQGIDSYEFSISWSVTDNTYFGIGVSHQSGIFDIPTSTGMGQPMKILQGNKFTPYSYSDFLGGQIDVTGMTRRGDDEWNYFTLTQKLVGGKFECTLYVNEQKFTTLNDVPMFPFADEGVNVNKDYVPHNLYLATTVPNVAGASVKAVGALRLFNRALTDKEAFSLVDDKFDGITELFNVVNTINAPYTIIEEPIFIRQHIYPDFVQFDNRDVVDIFGDESGMYLWKFDGDLGEEGERAVLLSSTSDYTYEDAVFDEGLYCPSETSQSFRYSLPVTSRVLTISSHIKYLYLFDYDQVGGLHIESNTSEYSGINFFYEPTFNRFTLEKYEWGIGNITYATGIAPFTVEEMTTEYHNVVLKLDLDAIFFELTVDNIVVFSGTIDSGSYNRMDGTPNELRIGYGSHGYGYSRAGYDQIRMFNKILSDDEVAMLKTEARPPVGFMVVNTIEEVKYDMIEVVNGIEAFKFEEFKFTQRFKIVSEFYKMNITQSIQQKHNTLFIKRIKE